MRSAASRDTDVTKQNNLYIKLQHSSAASLFRTSLEIGQNLHSTAKLRMMFAQLHQFKKLNSILYIIRNTLLKICILPAPPEVCYATPRGIATPSLGSPGLYHCYIATSSRHLSVRIKELLSESTLSKSASKGHIRNCCSKIFIHVQ